MLTRPSSHEIGEDMLHRRNLYGTAQVNGVTFEWRLEREPQWCTADGWRGMSVSLKQIDQKREAILNFPMPSDRRSALQPQLRRPNLSPRIVENGIRSALSQGWRPMSRGKADIFSVDADGNTREEFS